MSQPTLLNRTKCLTRLAFWN